MTDACSVYLAQLDEACRASSRANEAPIVEAMTILRHLQSHVPPSKEALNAALDKVRDTLAFADGNVWGHDIASERDRDIRRWLINVTSDFPTRNDQPFFPETPLAPAAQHPSMTPKKSPLKKKPPRGTASAAEEHKDTVLSMANSTEYRESEVVYAFRAGGCIELGESDNVIRGSAQHWLVVSKTNNPSSFQTKDIQIVCPDDFKVSYERVERTLNSYRRVGSVLAVCLTSETHIKMADGTVATGCVGDYLVQYDDAMLQQFMNAADFHARFVKVDDGTVPEAKQALKRAEALLPQDGSTSLSAEQHARIDELLAEDKLSMWNYPIFDLESACEGSALSLMADVVFQRLGFYKTFDISRPAARRCFRALQAGYPRDNPFHNATHAANVLHALYYQVRQTRAADVLTDVEKLACILAAVLLDHGHPARDNAFLTQTEHELALAYNDHYVLENHHVASAYVIIHQSGMFRKTASRIYKKVRGMVIELVIATNMSLHIPILDEWNEKLENKTLDESSNADKLLLMKVMMKASEFNHPTKPMALHAQWAEKVRQEYHHQGREERAKGLRPSPFMDNPDISQTQMSWIDFVVRPIFESLINFLVVDEEKKEESLWLSTLEENYEWYKNKKHQNDLLVDL